MAYGSKNVTLNKGEQHMTITKEDLAFIVQSAIINGNLKIEVTA